MAQGLCWLFAKLADLICVVISKSGKVALLQNRPSPAWVRAWIPRFLRWAGYLRAGEDVAAMDLWNSPAALNPVREGAAVFISRAQFALHGKLRVEFQPATFARFRARSCREATDFAFLKACVES